jgi:hypothetical protein
MQESQTAFSPEELDSEWRRDARVRPASDLQLRAALHSYVF